MNTAASIAASRTAGELVAHLKSHRDEAAAGDADCSSGSSRDSGRQGSFGHLHYTNPSNIACPHFGALFDSVHVEGVKAMTQDRRGKVSLVLPYFHELARALSSTGHDDAPAVLVVPVKLTRRGGAGCTYHRYRAHRGPGARQPRTSGQDKWLSWRCV